MKILLDDAHSQALAYPGTWAGRDSTQKRLSRV
jgi:hypothetical protein